MLHGLVGKDLFELPCSVPSLILFNVIDDVIVGNDLFVVIVDNAPELRNHSGIVFIVSDAILEFVNSFDDLGTEA